MKTLQLTFKQKLSTFLGFYVFEKRYPWFPLQSRLQQRNEMRINRKWASKENTCGGFIAIIPHSLWEPNETSNPSLTGMQSINRGSFPWEASLGSISDESTPFFMPGAPRLKESPEQGSAIYAEALPAGIFAFHFHQRASVCPACHSPKWVNTDSSE